MAAWVAAKRGAFQQRTIVLVLVGTRHHDSLPVHLCDSAGLRNVVYWRCLLCLSCVSSRASRWLVRHNHRSYTPRAALSWCAVRGTAHCAPLRIRWLFETGAHALYTQCQPGVAHFNARTLVWSTAQRAQSPIRTHIKFRPLPFLRYTSCIFKQVCELARPVGDGMQTSLTIAV